MVAGSIAAAGYHMGDGLHAARVSNPHGFFEDAAVNDLNDDLIGGVQSASCKLSSGQRWLTIPNAPVSDDQPQAVRSRIDQLLATRPFCFKDPRFSFTLPAWRSQLPEDTRFVCVFRRPDLTAASIVRESQTAPYLADACVDATSALDLWTATYRSIIEMADDPRWLFVHYDQMFSEDGRGRLGEHLGVKICADLVDADLRQHPDRLDVPPTQADLYAELCRRANYREEPIATWPPMKTIAVLVPVMPGEEQLVEDTVRSLRDQRGVTTTILVLDSTQSIDAIPGASVRPVTVPSVGPAVAVGLAELLAAETVPDLVALAIPGTISLPSRLAQAARLFGNDPVTQLVTCSHHIADSYDQFTTIVDEAGVYDEPGTLWQAGLVARPDALAAMSSSAFAPVELQLLRQQRRQNPDHVSHVPEPGFVVPAELVAAHETRSRNDARLADLADEPRPGTPSLVVSMCTFNRRDVLAESLEAFARQEVAPGTFEIVITNDGSSDGTMELLDALTLDIPFRIVHQENKGLSAARNAGLRETGAPLVLFVNDDTIPAVDCIERHLDAHARETGPIAVLGTFEQPAATMTNALTNVLETSDKVFGFNSMEDGHRYDCMRFMTCNVSVPLRSVRQVGCFDETFRHYGCEDTDLGLRLATLGYEVLFDASARAMHRHVLTLDDLRHRQKTVSAAFVHLYRKHPHALRAWGITGVTADGCRRDLAEAAQLGDLETRAAQLAEVDLGELLESRRSQAHTVLADLGQAIDRLNRVWWAEGYLNGFDRFALKGFTDLDSSGPWSIDPQNVRHVLALPDWSDPASLHRVMSLAAPLADEPGFSLLLYCDPDEVDTELALERLRSAYDSVLGGEGDLDITFETRELPLAELRRIATAVSAYIVSGTETDEMLHAVAAEHLTTPGEVRRWVGRFEGVPADSPTPIAHRAWRTVDGMIGDAEAQHLYELARQVDDGVIIEVGSYRGRSTVALAAGADDGFGAPVFAIEPHEPFDGILGGDFGPLDRGMFMQSMLTSGAYRNVRLVNLSSETVTPGWALPVGLLWIDGDHTYEGVRRDFECWAPHVLPGGIVAFDDATDPDLGPCQMLTELIDDGELEEISTIGRVRTFRLRTDAISLDELDASALSTVRSAA